MNALRVVALGPHDRYFLKYHDGRQRCSAFLPPELHARLCARSRPSVDFVALGPSGEWFMQSRDGSRCWGNTSGDFSSRMRRAEGRPLAHVAFGPDYSWFLQYREDGSCEYCIEPSSNHLVESLEQHIERECGPKVEWLAFGERDNFWLRLSDGTTNFKTDLYGIKGLQEEAPQRVVLGWRGSYCAFGSSSTGKWNVSPAFDEAIGYKSDSGGIYLDPESIRFTSSTISTDFSGKWGTIYDLEHSLRDSSVHVKDVPAIRVVQDRGVFWSLDNRRLWAFKRAWLPRIPVRIVNPDVEYVAKRFWCSDGLDIRIAGA